MEIVKDWSEIKLKQMVKFLKFESDKPKSFNDDLEELEYNLNLLSIFSKEDVGLDYVLKLKSSVIKSKLDELKDMLLNVPDFTLHNYFIWEGVKYSFVDFDDIGMGEYISYRKIVERHQGNVEMLPTVLAIICRPVKETKLNPITRKTEHILEDFDVKSLDFMASKLENVPVLLVMGSLNFFLTGKIEPTSNLNA